MNKNITFSGFSKQEVDVIAKMDWNKMFNKSNVITNKTIKSYLPQDYKYVDQFIYNLTQKKVLSPIKKGVYIFSPMWSLPVGLSISNFLIPNIFLPKQNYYIGYFNMFNYYGLTEQIPQTTFVINTSISKSKTIDNSLFQFVKVKSEYMYGITEQEISNDKVMVSDKERTMIDFMYQWGINSAGNRIEEFIREKECDVEKLIDYAIRFPRPTVRKCMGVILDKADIPENLTKGLYDSIKNTSITSAIWKSRKGVENKKWRVIINDITTSR